MEALESTILELESSKSEILFSLEEVNDSIIDLESNIDRVYEEQNDKLNPEIIDTLNGHYTKKEVENDLEIINNKIKQLEEEIKCK